MCLGRHPMFLSRSRWKDVKLKVGGGGRVRGGGGVEAQSGLKVKKKNKENFQLCSIITFEATKPAAHFFVPSHKSPKHLGAI